MTNKKRKTAPIVPTVPGAIGEYPRKKKVADNFIK